MMKSSVFSRLAALSLFSCVWVSGSTVAQTAQEGKNLGALASSNLAKKRPKPPEDLTGTYNFGFGTKGPYSNGSPFVAYVFLPLPKLTPTAQAQYDQMLAFQKKGLDYKDDAGACWPLGLPRELTRYWPLQVIQLPTETLIISMFENSIRWIYTDGRKHPDDDQLVYTYMGHSIGHWEGKTLVVDTVGLTGDHHWIQEGIPASDKLHVVERISRTPEGIQDEFTMTDPDNWEGEWKSTKYFKQDDHADIEEHICIYEEMSKLPSFKANVRE